MIEPFSLESLRDWKSNVITFTFPFRGLGTFWLFLLFTNFFFFLSRPDSLTRQTPDYQWRFESSFDQAALLLRAHFRNYIANIGRGGLLRPHKWACCTSLSAFYVVSERKKEEILFIYSTPHKGVSLENIDSYQLTLMVRLLPNIKTSK